MADESEQIDQNEIEELLRQSQGPADSASSEGTAAADTTDAAPADVQATLDQSEIEALMQGASSEPAGDQVSLDQGEIEAMMQAASSPTAAPPDAPPPPSPSPVPPSSPAVQNAPKNDIDHLLNQAEAALASIDANTTELPDGVQTFKLEDFSGTSASTEATTLDLMRDVQLDVKIELGRTHMQLEEVLKLGKGAVVPLDKLAGDPVDIFVNGRLIARGEVLVLNDNFCVRVAELIVGESACA